MANIKDCALAFEPKQTKNIADLEVVSVELELHDREGIDRDGKVFKYKVLVDKDVDYRVPGKVIGDLKAIIAKKPNLKTFSVTKTGEGLKTQYIVIPIE